MEGNHSSAYYGSIPGDDDYNCNNSPRNFILEQKIDSLLNSVSYIKEQSDQSISLNDQVSHTLEVVLGRISGLESRMVSLEASQEEKGTSACPNRKIPRELSVSLLA